MEWAQQRETEYAIVREIRHLVQSIGLIEQTSRSEESDRMYQQLEIKLQEYMQVRKLRSNGK